MVKKLNLVSQHRTQKVSTIVYAVVIGFAGAISNALADGSVHVKIYTNVQGGVSGGGKSVQRLYVKNFNAALISEQNGKKIEAATDGRGQLDFRYVPDGEYKLCWGGAGWLAGCAKDKIAISEYLNVMPAVEITPEPQKGPDGKERSSLLWGVTEMADGGPTVFQNALFGINQIPKIEAFDADGKLIAQTDAAADGSFTLPGIGGKTAKVRASLANLQVETPLTGGAAQNQAIKIVFPDRRPSAKPIIAEPLPRQANAPAIFALNIESVTPEQKLTVEWRTANGQVMRQENLKAHWTPEQNESTQSVFALISNANGIYNVHSFNTQIEETAAGLALKKIVCTTPKLPGSGQPGDVDPGMFLSYYEPSSNDQAIAYYKVMDPAMSFNAVTKEWSGGTHSNFKDWLLHAGFSVNAPEGHGIDHINSEQTAYVNFNDLGFGRRMTMRVDKLTGNVYAFVTNFGNPDQCLENANQAEKNKTPGPTVAMEYAPIPGQSQITGKVVKFFIYNTTIKQKDKAGLLNAAQLDSNPPKFVPNLCVTCHGGQSVGFVPAGGAITPAVASLRFNPVKEDSGAHFREFDLASFRYPSNVPTHPNHVPSGHDELKKFRLLNEFVQKTGPSPAIKELFNIWYPNAGPDFHADAVPAGWLQNSPNPPHKPDQKLVDLYHNVVERSCRTCHVALSSNIDWNTYKRFANDSSTIQNYVCQGKSARLMPHALITYINFWNSTAPNSPNFLGNFSDATATPAWSSAFGSCN